VGEARVRPHVELCGLAISHTRPQRVESKRLSQAWGPAIGSIEPRSVPLNLALSSYVPFERASMRFNIVLIDHIPHEVNLLLQSLNAMQGSNDAL
jgi:hypothetical protein